MYVRNTLSWAIALAPDISTVLWTQGELYRYTAFTYSKGIAIDVAILVSGTAKLLAYRYNDYPYFRT